jgi:hypothetical protein
MNIEPYEINGPIGATFYNVLTLDFAYRDFLISVVLLVNSDRLMFTKINNLLRLPCSGSKTRNKFAYIINKEGVHMLN